MSLVKMHQYFSGPGNHQTEVYINLQKLINFKSLTGVKKSTTSVSRHTEHILVI